MNNSFRNKRIEVARSFERMGQEVAEELENILEEFEDTPKETDSTFLIREMVDLLLLRNIFLQQAIGKRIIALRLQENPEELNNNIVSILRNYSEKYSTPTRDVETDIPSFDLIEQGIGCTRWDVKISELLEEFQSTNPNNQLLSLDNGDIDTLSKIIEISAYSSGKPIKHKYAKNLINNATQFTEQPKENTEPKTETSGEAEENTKASFRWVWKRRRIITLLGAVSGGIIANFLSPAVEEATAELVSMTSQGVRDALNPPRVRIEGDFENAVILKNRNVFFEITQKDTSDLTGISKAGFTPREVLTEDISPKPVSPVSETETTQPRFQDRELSETEQWSEKVGSYKVTRRFMLNEVPIIIRWTTILHSKDRFALNKIRITNEGRENLQISQDKGDIHKGIQLFRSMQLANQRYTDIDYKFHIPTNIYTEDTWAFNEIYKEFQEVQTKWWGINAGTRWGTIFDDEVGMTFGFLSGSTPPWMWVATKNSLSYMVQKKSLKPQESIGYVSFIGFHPGGERSPQRGEEMYQKAQNRLSQIQNDFPNRFRHTRDA